MKEKESRHVVDLLFTLGLFCVLAATALMVVLIGADVYRKTVSNMTENYNTRTSITYLAEKVRQNDVQGSVVYETTVEGGDALVLEQQVGDSAYQTWIFVYEGNLREVLVKKDTPVKGTDGQAIMELQSLQVKQQDGMLLLAATDMDGNRSEIKLSPRCQ